MVRQTETREQKKKTRKKGREKEACRILGFHSGGYEEFYLLRCIAVYSFEIKKEVIEAHFASMLRVGK
jgi:ribosomal protein S14